MLRKMMVIIIIVIVSLLMTGCNLEEKIGENITEGIVEKASGGDLEVEIDGDNVTYSTDEGEMTIDEEDGLTFEGEDGSVVSAGGEYEWPEDQAAEYMPKFDGGKISYIYNATDSCMLMVDGLEKDNYDDYIKEVVKKGYTEDKVESTAEDMMLYSGSSKDGVSIAVYFIPSEGSMQISVDASSIVN